MNDSEKKDSILFARPAKNVVVVRVVGRGNHALSHSLKQLMDDLNTKDYSPRYVIDLKECICLDSTFMGTMATLALHQSSCRKDRSVVLNTSPITRRQLTTLGLNFLLEVSDGATSAETQMGEGDFEATGEAQPANKFDQVLHMIEAHTALVDIDSGNEVKFKGVLDALNESLKNEEEKSQKN